jgi:hypothetical protein
VAWQQLHPKIPHILVHHVDTGGAWVGDSRTREQVFCPDEDCIAAFAADHSGGPYALGNLVHRVLAAVGFKRCGACAQRQTEMNVWSPFG